MTLTAPPRPPSPNDPVTHGEFDALVQALIEEARRRAQRRRRIYAALAVTAVLVGIAAFAAYERTAGSQTVSPALAARPSPVAGAARSQIAFMRDPPGEGGQAHHDLYVMNPDGSGQRLLAHEAGLEGQMTWSPDGRE